MAQHDYVIDSQASASARADLNNLFLAIASQNSGATAPATTYANMFWYDTSTDLLKMRNEANSAFITLGTVDQTNNIFIPSFLASQAEAEAGSSNIKGMTPLRVAQAIAALGTATGVNVRTITTTSTYTPTSGYNYGIAFVTNAGAVGANGAGDGASGQGGGAGSTAIGTVDLSAPRAVTIGASSGGASSLAGFTSVQVFAGSPSAGVAQGKSTTGGSSFWGKSFGAGGNGYAGNGSTGSGSGTAGQSGIVIILEFK